MLVTNGEVKKSGAEKASADPAPAELVQKLPAPLRFIFNLLHRVVPKHIPVAIKLAVSIGVMLTLIMTSLGMVIIHNQSSLIRNQITVQGSLLVQTLARPLGEIITLAQVTPKSENSNKAPTEMDKQDPLLSLNLMVTQMASGSDIIGVSIYSADRKELLTKGISPFSKQAPYADKEKTFLDGNLQILDWRSQRSPRGEISAISYISPVELQNTVVGHAMVTFNHELMDRSIRNAVQSIVIATLVMILLGIVLSYMLGRQLTKPLYHLIDASRAIGAGNYSYRLSERRNDEIGYLMTSFNQMAQGLYQKAQVEEAFSRHVSPVIAREIIDNMDETAIGGKHFHASVLFVDIVSFTAISETMPAEGVATLLNEFYTNISKVAQQYNGVIDKFMGDCAMVVFGIPKEDEDHVYNSIACAVCFQKLMRVTNRHRQKQGLFPIHFRIGVNTGDMLAGTMGSSERIQYTVVGDSVNLASRLCTAAPPDRIIVTDDTYHLAGLKRKVIATRHERMRIRGISNPVNTYLVQDLQEPYLHESTVIIKKILDDQQQLKAVSST